MPGDISYRSKYLELRAKYLNDLDTAFRLGFEQGAQQAQMDQMAQQAAQAQAQAAAMAGGQPGEDQGGQFGEEGGEEEGAPGMPNAGEAGAIDQGSELDNHIAELEGMVSNSSAPAEETQAIQKSLAKLKAFRKSQLDALNMKKSEAAIKAIGKALKKPEFKLSERASKNMTPNAKQSLTLQHKIVNDIMEKMEAEEKKASEDIKNILGIDGIIKG